MPAFARLWDAALDLLHGGRDHDDASSARTPARPVHPPLAKPAPPADDPASSPPNAVVFPHSAAECDGGSIEAIAPVFDRNRTSTMDPPLTAMVMPTAAPSQPQLAPLPDPDFDRLLARAAKLQAQKLDLAARLADMQRTVREFEQRQYAALDDILGECLRLRHEYARLKADRSGAAADRDEAQAAANDFDSYRSAAEARPAALPELDEEEREALRRLYRTAASRCHPDRASEADQQDAHARFLRVQEAYRGNDVDGLRTILAELDAGANRRSADEVVPHDAAGTNIRRHVGALQNQVADLILAIQTLQLDSVYREANRIDDWDRYFAQARRAFENECAALRRQMRMFAMSPA